MGHPDNYTEATPKGYKENVVWHPMPDTDFYSEEEKAKLLKEILKNGTKKSKIAAHSNETNNHPKKPDPPARHKDEIKKCATEDCELSEDEITDKLKEIAKAKEESSFIQKLVKIDNMN